MEMKMPKTFSEVYRPKSPDEQRFVDKHVVVKHADRNGNGDDLFNAKNVKKINRKKENHGYESGDDAKVYENISSLDEVTKEQLQKLKDGKYVYKITSKRPFKYVVGNYKPSKVIKISEELETIEASLLEYFDEIGQEVSYEELQELALGLQEEVLDELSGAYLGSYIAKSKNDERKRKEKGIEIRDKIRAQTGLNIGTPMDRKLYSPVASRKAGYTRALDKLTGKAKVNVKEETLDEISKPLLGRYIKSAGVDAREAAVNRDKYFRDTKLHKAALATKYIKRREKGISKAVDKLTKENLDEISKPLLGRYIKSAGVDAREAAVNRDKYFRDTKLHKAALATKYIKRREKGISKAVDKLTKENLDNIINRYNQEEISLEEALLEKIAHLSESHQNLIITLFDTLSEDNQELLFNTLDDTDGINETIDFALESELNELSKR